MPNWSDFTPFVILANGEFKFDWRRLGQGLAVGIAGGVASGYIMLVEVRQQVIGIKEQLLSINARQDAELVRLQGDVQRLCERVSAVEARQSIERILRKDIDK